MPPAVPELGQSEAARILLYSHDGFGLGHLRRNSKLAGRLVRELPGATAILIAGFPGTPGVDLPAGVDLVKLPAIRKLATDQWEPRHLRVDVPRLQAMRRGIVDGIFASFAPHLVIVDYLPLGVWGELLGPLSRLRRQHPRAGIVLGLRDVLDSPLVTRRLWRAEGHDEAVRRLFDAVLVYGDRELYDTARVYGLDELAPGRAHFTGYVCSDEVAGDVDGVRRELGVAADEQLALVTAGGGADAFEMMRLAVRAGRLLAAGGRRLRTLAVTGPLMATEQVAELQRLTAGSSVTVERWRPRLEATMAAADVVVTMAAYNTLTEAVRLQRPVVAIPRPGPSAEQVTRARLFAERGLLRTLPVESAPEQLAETLCAALDEPSAAPRPPAMDGLDRATGHLCALLDVAIAASAEASNAMDRRLA
jgi:predicted glycosyltransferase